MRKSRFLALAGPVDTPEQALGFIERHRVPEATHNCWAYRIGQQYRFHDDGEPGGTAGRPILQAIEGQDVDGVVVLVVRWFGGIKLGAGGLVRAYGGAAAQCLRLADKALRVPQAELHCACAFGDMALLQSRFAASGVQVTDEQFTDTGVRWRLRLPADAAPAFVALVRDLTRGQGVCELCQIQ